MSGDERPVASPSQTVGPFFHFGLATDPSLGRLAAPDTPGERIRLRMRVLDGDGAPVPDALVEIYQADSSGAYGRSPFTGFGRLPTDRDGVCVFDTIRPGAVADEQGGVQAPHVNVCVLARGLMRQVYTRVYFRGDAALSADRVLSLVPQERRQTLVASPANGDDGTWDFVIRLQGDNETVFFDL